MNSAKEELLVFGSNPVIYPILKVFNKTEALQKVLISLSGKNDNPKDQYLVNMVGDTRLPVYHF